MMNTKPPAWFWIVSALALLWNLMGVYAYIAQVSMDGDALAALTEAEQALHAATPAWATAAFAIAVFGGALGCIALLLRKTWARPLFILSLIAILVQMSYNLFMSDSMEVYGPGAVAMPVMILAFGVFLIWLSGYAGKKGWLT